VRGRCRAAVDVQGPEADSPAPLHRGLIDRLQVRPHGTFPLKPPLRRGGDVEGTEVEPPAPRCRGLLGRLQTPRGARRLLLLGERVGADSGSADDLQGAEAEPYRLRPPHFRRGLHDLRRRGALVLRLLEAPQVVEERRPMRGRCRAAVKKDAAVFFGGSCGIGRWAWVCQLVVRRGGFKDGTLTKLGKQCLVHNFIHLILNQSLK
jgi:hypothetical protein